MCLPVTINFNCVCMLRLYLLSLFYVCGLLSLFYVCDLFSLFYIKFCGFQQANSENTVVAFLIFPTKTNNFNVESLRGQAIAKQLKDTVHHVQNQIGKRICEQCLR